MDSQDHQQLAQLRRTHLPRLYVLQQRQARLGISTPPEVEIEIVDLQAKIDAIDAELGTAEMILPAAVADFIGRSSEIAQIEQWVTQALTRGTPAIICIRGMGGIGKTQVALAASQATANHFPDGQILVSLRTNSSETIPPMYALQSVVRAFARETQIPDTIEQIQAHYRALLNGKHMLILVDDARDVGQVRPMTPPAGCGLLITTRQRFSMPGMSALDLGTLPEEIAVQFLLQLCPRIGEYAGRIALLCGYLPLALRVGASVLSNDDTLSVQRYLERLSDVRKRLTYLRDPSDPELDVAASLELSYSALTTVEQDALSQISVFPASFDLAAATNVVHPQADDTETLLGALRRRNLVEFDATNERYHLQELVRTFAQARQPVADDVYERHARYYATIALRSASLYHQGGANIATGLALFDKERTHIDTGWDWARQHAGTPSGDDVQLMYADAIHFDIGVLRYVSRTERIPRLNDALAAARRLGRQANECHILNGLGAALVFLGELPQGQAYHEQALAQAQALGDSSEEALTFIYLGIVYEVLNEIQQACAYQQRALEIARASSDVWLEGLALTNLGNAYAAQNEFQRAIECYDQALIIDRKLGDSRGESGDLCNLGIAYKNVGKVKEALIYYEQALALAKTLQDRSNIALQSWNLGRLLAQQGEIKQAVPLLQVCVDYEREINHVNAASDAIYLESIRAQIDRTNSVDPVLGQ